MKAYAFTHNTRWYASWMFLGFPPPLSLLCHTMVRHSQSSHSRSRARAADGRRSAPCTFLM